MNPHYTVKNIDTLDGQRTPIKWFVTYSMEVSVWVLWHIIVEDNVDSLDIHATPKEISCYEDTLLEGLESLIPRQSRQTRIEWKLRLPLLVIQISWFLSVLKTDNNLGFIRFQNYHTLFAYLLASRSRHWWSSDHGPLSTSISGYL